jgi:hypothetical protein
MEEVEVLVVVLVLHLMVQVEQARLDKAITVEMQLIMVRATLVPVVVAQEQLVLMQPLLLLEMVV